MGKENTINLTDLINETYENLPIESSKAETGAAIKTMLDEIGKAVARGETVSLLGFGSFKSVDRAERQVRNPRTGEKMLIPARKAVKFTPGKGFKERLNK